MNIEHENNIESLREYAKILKKENEILHRRIAELTLAIAHAQGKDTTAQLELELQLIKEKLEARTRELFGPSSEKRKPEDMHSKKEGEEKERRPRKGHGPHQQISLPVVEEIHTLDEADMVCPKCGGMLKEMEGQFEESEEVHVIEKRYVILKHKKQKYRCSCESCVETALGGEKLISGGRYSVEFAVDVAISKYADHMPLHRQQGIMARQGLQIEKQTLWDQIWALSRHLKPTYDAILAHLRSKPVIGADETTWKMMGKGKTSTYYVWCLAGEDCAYFSVHPTRSSQVVVDLLSGYDGTVVVDGYQAYGSAQDQIFAIRDGPPYRLAFCWAHVRRKFIEAEPNYPEAEEMIDLIGELYDVERAAKDGTVLSPMDYLEKARRERSVPILEKIHSWLLRSKVKYLPESSMGKAISYTLKLWDGLVRFASDPQVWIDNNPTERALRAVALGRKNHYGSRSDRGTDVASIFYSLMGSARLVGLNPQTFLTEATRRAIRNPGTVTIPYELVKEQSLVTANPD